MCGNQNRTPHSLRGVVFTKLRPTLGRTRGHTDRQTDGQGKNYTLR